ncbi:MAG: T9SS type A sorting domain-containing protein [Chlorobi bacterium]|nr:T9SS type A sorting domain-containing protein [Chlorobiota bacterium]
MIFQKKIVLTFFLLINIALLFSQEVLYDLSNNPSIINYNKIHKNSIIKSSLISKSLELPFIEDFSDTYIFPDTNLWADINPTVYINSEYPVNPPSIGVATFDAIDYNGWVYSRASQEPFLADQLTSKPINLDYPLDSNIVFSFFYQPQGLGNEPEKNDSLTLDFFAPELGKWKRVWDTTGSALYDFKQIMISIIDTSFLKDGFKFRFKNYASLANINTPGSNANADQWHIDYIRIDKNRTLNDTILKDIGFIYPIQSIVPDFEAIPWQHFLNTTFSEYPKLYLKYANRDTALRKVSSWFSVKDMNGNTPDQKFEVWGSNLEYNQIIEAWYKTGSITYEDNGKDEGLFLVKGYLDIDEDYDYRKNDTTIYYQHFSNYYAYDDGTAENGYGLLSKNALLAYKFTTIKRDSLKAIQIHFNSTKDNYTASKYFYLNVWKDTVDDDGIHIPGDTIYHEVGLQVLIEDSLNDFSTYTLSREIILSGTFYIGLEQTTSDMLNIGFDLNRNAKDKLFYNINGIWRNTRFDGALMMRPVFSNTRILSSSTKKQMIVEINPVPSSDIITININGKHLDSNNKIYVYDQFGRMVMSKVYISSTLNISHLLTGIYIIKIIDNNGNTSTGKFIVIN